MTAKCPDQHLDRRLPKRPIPHGVITPLGLEGDLCAHPTIHGGPRQAVLIIAAEAVDELIASGYPLFYGALGENLTPAGWTRASSPRPDLPRRRRTHRADQSRAPCDTLDIYAPPSSRKSTTSASKAGDPASPRWA